MKKIFLAVLTMLACMMAPESASATSNVKFISGCWYDHGSTEIFSIVYDKHTYNFNGNQVYLWVQDGGGNIYGPIVPANTAPVVGSNNRLYTFNLGISPNFISLPSPHDACYKIFSSNVATHPSVLEIRPEDWDEVCKCSDVPPPCNADFSLTQYSYVNLAVTLTPHQHRPNYVYTVNWGDGTTSPANTSHIYSSSGSYNICLTADDNNGDACEKCMEICIYGDNQSSGKPGRTSGISNQNKDKSLSIYPVPAENILNISYITVSKEKTKILITDINGKTVNELKNDSNIGNNNVEVSTESFHPGIYFIKIQTSNKTLTKKFTVIK